MMRTLALAIVLLVSLAHTPTVSATGTSALDTIIFNMAVSPNGQLLAMATSSGVCVYRLSTGQLMYVLHEKIQAWEGIYANIAWSPDGSNLAIGKPNPGVRIWDVSSWQILADKFPSQEGIDYPGFAWSPNGTQLAVGMGGASGEILIWDKKTDSWTKLTAYTGRQVSLVWASDGRLLVMAEQALYDAYTGQFVRELSTPIDGAYGYAVWSPDTKRVFVFFDLGGFITNALTNQPDGFGACCYAAIAWSMDGRYFAATSSHDDNEIWVWDTQAKKVVVRQKQGESIYALAFLPNYELLAAGSIAGHEVLWNTTTRRVLFSLPEYF